MKKETAINKALKYANEEYGENDKVKFVLRKEYKIIEDDEIFYVPFIEEKTEHRKLWGGAYKGIIIDKTTGEMFQPGSAYPLEKWIWGFKLGFRKERVDFIIKKINNQKKTIELISNLGMQYVIPELEHGTIWKIPKTFNPKQIKKRISKLPCTFKNQGLTIALDTIQEILESKAFEFEIKTTDFTMEGIYGELIDKNHLIK